MKPELCPICFIDSIRWGGDDREIVCMNCGYYCIGGIKQFNLNSLARQIQEAYIISSEIFNTECNDFNDNMDDWHLGNNAIDDAIFYLQDKYRKISKSK